MKTSDFFFRATCPHSVSHAPTSLETLCRLRVRVRATEASDSNTDVTPPRDGCLWRGLPAQVCGGGSRRCFFSSVDVTRASPGSARLSGHPVPDMVTSHPPRHAATSRRRRCLSRCLPPRAQFSRFFSSFDPPSSTPSTTRRKFDLRAKILDKSRSMLGKPSVQTS